MKMIRACSLAVFGSVLACPASAAFPGKYTLDAAWPADLAKIGVRMSGAHALRLHPISVG